MRQRQVLGARALVMAPQIRHVFRMVAVSPAAAEPVIRLRGVSKQYGGTRVLDNLDLEIPPKQTTVIVGESGSGKSVLIKLMNGLVLPDSGSVELFGRDTARVPRQELMALRRRVGTLFQSYALFDSMSVFDNVAFPLLEHSQLSRQEIAERAQELLTFFALDDAGPLPPAALSGGMKKRVSLARALITQPEVVLFDEPTTGLDPIMIEFVDKMLLDSRERYSLTSVIISHDMASAFNLADRMAMLHDGKISFVGTSHAFRSSARPEIRRFVSQQLSRLDAQTGANGDASEDTSDAGLAYADLIEPTEPPAVVVRNLHKQFGDRKILDGVNFYILPKRITTLIGGSGSGKTVTMKHILGLLVPTQGSVTVFGDHVASLSPAALLQMRRRFGMLFQGAALFDSMSVFDNVAFPLREMRAALRPLSPTSNAV